MPPADPSEPRRLEVRNYVLKERQAPSRCKVSVPGKEKEKEKDRRYIEPPPVLQLQIADPMDPASNYLQSPYYLMLVALWHETEDKAVATTPKGEPALTGSLSSSLHRVKDPMENNQDCGLFAFGDLSVTMEGKFRLNFVLWEVMDGCAVPIRNHITNVFEVMPIKAFPGYPPSTQLTRSLFESGIRLRTRKETPRAAQKRNLSKQFGDPVPNLYAPPPGGMMHIQHQQRFPEMEEPDAKRHRMSYAGPHDPSSGRPGDWTNTAHLQNQYPAQAMHSYSTQPSTPAGSYAHSQPATPGSTSTSFAQAGTAMNSNMYPTATMPPNAPHYYRGDPSMVNSPQYPGYYTHPNHQGYYYPPRQSDPR